MSVQFNRIGVLASHEYAANATYKEVLQHALVDIQDDLRDIQMDHEKAVQLLQSISMDDCTIGNEFGVWEMMNKAMPGVEKLFGKRAALQSLHDCEELSIREYEACLRDNGIPYKGRTIIVNRLIPQARDHIKQLERLIKQSTESSWNLYLRNLAAS